MTLHTLICRFDYGFWSVTVESRYGMAHAMHSWLTVAVVQALWRHRRNKRTYSSEQS